MHQQIFFHVPGSAEEQVAAGARPRRQDELSRYRPAALPGPEKELALQTDEMNQDDSVMTPKYSIDNMIDWFECNVYICTLHIVLYRYAQ